jgi:hypothetical protein
MGRQGVPGVTILLPHDGVPVWTEEYSRADRVSVPYLLSRSSGIPMGALGIPFAAGDETPPMSEIRSDPGIRLARAPGAALGYLNLGYGVPGRRSL